MVSATIVKRICKMSVNQSGNGMVTVSTWPLMPTPVWILSDWVCKEERNVSPEGNCFLSIYLVQRIKVDLLRGSFLWQLQMIPELRLDISIFYRFPFGCVVCWLVAPWFSAIINGQCARNKIVDRDGFKESICTFSFNSAFNNLFVMVYK